MPSFDPKDYWYPGGLAPQNVKAYRDWEGLADTDELLKLVVKWGRIFFEGNRIQGMSDMANEILRDATLDIAMNLLYESINSSSIEDTFGEREDFVYNIIQAVYETLTCAFKMSHVNWDKEMKEV